MVRYMAHSREWLTLPMRSAPRSVYCFNSIARRIVGETVHVMPRPRILRLDHKQTGENRRERDAAFLSSRTQGREPRRALSQRLPASVAQLKIVARACSMEIMMISSKCRIAPYGMLKLSVSWPWCVVLIKPRRWPYRSVDGGNFSDELYIRHYIR